MTKTIPLFSLAFACIPAYLAAEPFTPATFNIRCPADKTPHTWQERAIGKYNVNYPIDYIFVSKEFKVLSHRTDDTKFTEGYASDHYPVIVNLDLQ